MDARILVVLFFVFLLIISPDDHRASSSQHSDARSLLQQQQQAIDAIQLTRNGDFEPSQDRWVDAPGLRREDGFAWDLLPAVKERARQQAREALQQNHIETSRGSFEDLDAGSFGQRYLDVDNLDGSDVQSSAPSPSVVPFYQNVTGTVQGQWTRSSLAEGHIPPLLNLSALFARYPANARYTHNVTGRSGDICLKLDEKHSNSLRAGTSLVREIKADLTIQDESAPGNGWEATLHGLHFPEAGTALLATTSEKFSGLPALPHLLRSGHQFEVARTLLNQTLHKKVAEVNQTDGPLVLPWSSTQGRALDTSYVTPACEYILYLQQHLVYPFLSPGPRISPGLSALERLEAELRAPTGAPQKFVPKLVFSAVIFSPDCGYIIESKGPSQNRPHEDGHLTGFKSEVHYTKIRGIGFFYVLVLACQLMLLKRQMKESSTPSTRSRISYYTIGIMALGDGFVFLSFVALGLLVDAVYLTYIASSFVAFLGVSLFAMQFIMDIWAAQEPEREERRRAQERQNTSDATRAGLTLSSTPGDSSRSAAPVTMPAAADGLPLPVTARQPATTSASPVVILPPDQDIEADATEDDTAAASTVPLTAAARTRREQGTLYTKFYLLLVGLLLLTLGASSWPRSLRTYYIRALAFSYFSFWWPQLVRNARRNCRRALRWDYVLGQSVLRVLPAAYLCTAPAAERRGLWDNVLFLKSDVPTLLGLVAWVWLQVLLLLSQETLGPRFFVPAAWVPPVYDYHPVLREDEEEAIIVGGSAGQSPDSPVVEGATQAKEKGKKLFDCAICMQAFEVPVVPRDGREGVSGATASALGAGLFGRRMYMVTPCRYVRSSLRSRAGPLRLFTSWPS